MASVPHFAQPPWASRLIFRTLVSPSVERAESPLSGAWGKPSGNRASLPAVRRSRAGQGPLPPPSRPIAQPGIVRLPWRHRLAFSCPGVEGGKRSWELLGTHVLLASCPGSRL